MSSKPGAGQSYASWRGPFFPENLAPRLHLQFYAGRFGTTELNGVFYRTPTEAAVRTWTEQTPDHFVFAWKASKFITVLFQLPPQFEKNRSRIEEFLRLLPPRRRYAFEFRHPSWYEDDIIQPARARHLHHA